MTRYHLALPRIEPTREHLQRAFDRLRQPGWPISLDEALLDPSRAGCIRGLAVNLAREQLAGPALPAPPGPPAHTAVRRLPQLHSRAGAFDARRAAANDRDDDE